MSFEVTVSKRGGFYSYEAKRGGRTIKTRGRFASEDAAMKAAQHDLARLVVDKQVIEPFSKSMEKLAKDLNRSLRRSGLGSAKLRRR